MPPRPSSAKWQPPHAASSDSTSSVTAKLNNLRGEHFRRDRNARHSHFQAPVSVASASSIVIPDWTDAEDTTIPRAPTALAKAGPAPPRSWTTPPARFPRRQTKEWRTSSLSLLFRELPSPYSTPRAASIHTLQEFCLASLFSAPSLPLDEISLLPTHLRAYIARYAAIHRPLDHHEMEAIYGDEGHADGELIVISHFPSSLRKNLLASSGDPIVDDWDEPTSSAPYLRSVALLDVVIPALPPTITHLVLSTIPEPVPSLTRFPQMFPLLVFLDISNNPAWSNAIHRVEWKKWARLEVLGVRGMQRSLALEQAVNYRGRQALVRIIWEENGE